MTRSATKFSVLALVLGTALVASVAPAAVYAPIGDASLVGRAHEAALVRAVASETGMLAPGLPETRTRFEVIETLRGGLGREVEVGVLGGDVGDGTTLVVPDVPRFEPGRVYLLLLARRDDGRYGVVEQSLGAFDVVEDEAGTRFATRLSFAGQKSRPVAVTGPDGAARAEREPMRKLTEFAAAIRGSQGALATEMSAYAGAASGKTVPVRETRGVSAMWDSNWNGQRARYNTGASAPAVAAVSACDVLPATPGQSGVAGGGLDQLIQAATEWSTVPFEAKGARIAYGTPSSISNTCPQTASVNSGQVVVAFDDTAVTGAALACGEGGILATGAWLTDNTTHTWKTESYKTIKAGQVWVRRVDCSAYPTDLFYAVLLHGLGNTLGLSNSDVSQSSNDVDPTDNLRGVMVSTFGPVVPSGVGSDDIDGACWLYGPCGDTTEPLQAAFYFPNPSTKLLPVTFYDRSRGTPTTWNWNFGDSTPDVQEPNPVHTYAAAGRYSVTLTVTRTLNGVPSTSSVTQSISVLTDIVPQLSLTPATIEEGQSVAVGLTMIRGKAKSPATLSFDDGSSAPTTSVNGVNFATTNHTYTEPGVYYVRATVQDADDAVAPGVTGPESFATTQAVVTVYPVACVVPMTRPAMALPESVRLGNNLFVSWVGEQGFDPRLDYYEVNVSTTEAFTAGTVSSFRAYADFLVYWVTSVPQGGKLYARVRIKKQCATPLTGDWSNVANTTVTRPPTVVSLSTFPAAMFYRIGSQAATPTAKYCYVNATYSTNDANLALVLQGTDATAFTLDKATLTIPPGETGCVIVTPVASTLTTAGRRVATLLATYEAGSMGSTVELLVSSSNPPPAATVFRSAASKLNFSAAAGATPLPMTLAVNITPPPQAGQTIELEVSRKPSWLAVDQPAGGLKFDASGQLVLTVRVNRALREYPGAPQSGDLVLVLAASNPQVSLSIPVLDMEPYAVQSGQGGIRSVRFAPLDTLVESPGSFFLASAVEGPGLAGSFFSTDAWVRNGTNVDDLPIEFWYTPSGKNGMTDAGVLLAQTTVKANRTLRLSSFLPTVFGLPQGSSGMVEVRSRFAGAFSFRSRTQSSTGADPALLFGAEMPAVSATDGVDATSGEAVIPGIVSSAKSRTNLILANPTRDGVTVTAKVTNADGGSSGTISGIQVPPYSRIQIDGVVEAAGLPSLALGSVSVKVTSGVGRVVPVASVIDNASNSFSLVKGRRVGTGSFRSLIVPGVVRATGAFETNYRTALNIANGTSTPANLQITYRYYDLELAGKAGEATVNVTIPAFGSLPAAQAGDALSALFGRTGQTYGWISVEGEVQKVVVAAVISAAIDNANEAKGRTAAQTAAIPSTSTAITRFGAPAIGFAGAQKSSQQRSNMVLLETAGGSASLQVILSDVTGTIIGTKPVELKAFEYLQVNDLFGPTLFDVGDGPFSNMNVAVQVTGGTGRVLSFVSTIVNASRNPEIFLLTPSGP